MKITGEYIPDPTMPLNPLITMEHLNGVPWEEAPRPRRFHRHWAQTRGVADLRMIERCPCGGLRIDGYGGWM